MLDLHRFATFGCFGLKHCAAFLKALMQILQKLFKPAFVFGFQSPKALGDAPFKRASLRFGPAALRAEKDFTHLFQALILGGGGFQNRGGACLVGFVGVR
ncbi:MAG: hypothetical protein ABJD53_13845 [Gammaproteobacteria bacterium]